MKNFLKFFHKFIMFLLLALTFLAGLWKLLIGCKHTRFISDLSEFPPTYRKTQTTDERQKHERQ
jgi:hypothetical protein